MAAEVISIQSGCDSYGTGSNEYVMRWRHDITLLRNGSVTG